MRGPRPEYGTEVDVTHLPPALSEAFWRDMAHEIAEKLILFEAKKWSPRLPKRKD